MPLSSKNCKTILEIIETIYDVPDNGAMFAAVCLNLQKLMDICSAVYAPADPKTGEMLLNDYEYYNDQERALIVYLKYYAPLDPFIVQGWFINQPNNAARNTDLVPKGRLLESEFGRDFLIPVANVFYGLASSLMAQGDNIGMIGLHRQLQQRDFSDREKKIINILLPHMARAIRNRHLLQSMDFVKEPDGVIAVGEDDKPFYVNAEAGRILKDHQGRLPDPGLGAHPVFFKSLAAVYRVRTVPFGRRGRSKVFLLELHPPEHKLRSKLDGFGLSQREVEVSILAIQGLSNREIAEKLFITEQTVKDHLYHVFEKMNIRRRSELSAKVLGLSL